MEGMTARQLETLRRKLAQEFRRKSISGELSEEMESKLKSKMDEINSAIGERLESERLASDPKRIKGVTEHIKDEPMKLKTGEEFKSDLEAKRAAARKMSGKSPKLKTKTVAGKGLLGKLGKSFKKGLPALGAVMAGVNILGAPEAQASEVAMEEAEEGMVGLVPGGVDKLGPEEGTPESIMEDPTRSPEERRRAAEMLKKKFMK